MTKAERASLATLLRELADRAAAAPAKVMAEASATGADLSPEVRRHYDTGFRLSRLELELRDIAQTIRYYVSDYLEPVAAPRRTRRRR